MTSFSTQVAEQMIEREDHGISSGINPNITPAPIDENDPIYQLAWKAADAADDRKGGDIVIVRVGEVSSLAEYFVMVTGYSKVQVRAIANAVDEKIKEVFGREPLRMAGMAEGLWSCIDYGDVVVHVQLPDQRDFYGLEAFWGHAPRIPFIPSVPE